MGDLSTREIIALRRRRAAEQLIHAVDTMRVLEDCGRATANDKQSLAEAVARWDAYRDQR